MTTNAERGDAPLSLASDLSAAEDGFTTGRSFEAAFEAHEPTLSSEALPTYDAVKQANIVIQREQDDNMVQKAVIASFGQDAWPSTYQPPDYPISLVSGTPPPPQPPMIGFPGGPSAPPSDITQFDGMGSALEVLSGTDDEIDQQHRTDWTGDAVATVFTEMEGVGDLLHSYGTLDEYVLGEPRRDPFVHVPGEGPVTFGTEGLGNFEQATGLTKVVRAASKPLTKGNQAVAYKLLDQADKLGALMEKRAIVTENARKEYRKLLAQVTNIDVTVQQLLDRVFTPTGDLREDADPRVLQRIKKLRRQAIDLARKGIRYQKTNIIGSGLTENGYGQARLLQQMAVAVTAGNPALADALSALYEKLGANSKTLREVRAQQVKNWSKRPSTGLEGLGFDGNACADYWQTDLGALAYVEGVYLDELCRGLSAIGAYEAEDEEDLEGFDALEGRRSRRRRRRARRRARRARRRARLKRVVKRAAKKVAKATVRVGQKIRKSQVAKGFRSVAKPLARAVKSVAKVAIVSPIKGTIGFAKGVAKGNPRAAFKAIGRSFKETGKGIVAVGTNLTGGLVCGLTNTRLGGAVAQGVGKAVGTVYGGGTVGGAVGQEVGRKAHEVNQGMCKGMKQLGLTGEKNIDLRAKNIRKSMKVVSRDLKKKFSKEEMLKSLARIAAGVVPGAGSAAGGIAAQLSVNALKDKALDVVKKKGIQLATRGASKVVGGRAGRLIGAAAQAAAGGKVDAEAVKRFAISEAKRGGRRLARRAGTRAAQRVLGRRAGSFVAQAAQAGVAARRGGARLSVDPAQLRRLARTQGRRFARTQGRRLARRAGERVAGRVLGSRAAAIASAAARGRLTPAQARMLARAQFQQRVAQLPGGRAQLQRQAMLQMARRLGRG